MRVRDSQRSKLYTAQQCLPGYWTNEFGTVPQTQKWLNDVLAARWFRTRWRLHEVEVRSGNGAGVSYSTHIALGTVGRNPPIVLHELAHQIITRATPDGHRLASHGPEFAAVFLFLVRQVIGADTAKELRASYTAHKVKYRTGAYAVPEPRYNIPSQAAVRERKRIAAAQPIQRSSRQVAVDVIRRAAQAGEFGPPGRKTRTAALATARTLEKGLE